MSNKYQSYKTELQKLLEKHGHLTPEILLDEARNKKSKLHAFFQWDNAKAAHQWRLEQASFLLRSVKITIETESGEKVSTRAFVHIRLNDEESDEEPESRGRYYSLDTVLADDAMTAQMMEEAMRDLRSFHRKYFNLKQLAPVMAAIDDMMAINA